MLLSLVEAHQGLDGLSTTATGTSENPLIGVEVEVEFQSVDPRNNTLDTTAPPLAKRPRNASVWVSERDGSLRGNSAEYVLDNPLPLDVAKDKVEALYNWITARPEDIREPYLRVRDSMRAGVHIHFNQRNRTVLQMLNFAVLYWILEESLVDAFCGAERAGNLFCLRLVDADYPLTYLHERISNRSRPIVHRETQNSIRYAGLNLSAIGRYGSLEFRSLRTPTTAQPILDWITVLNCVQQASLRFDTPEAILASVSGDNPDGFVRSIFEGQPQLFAQLNPTTLEEQVLRGTRLVQSFAYTLTWR